jgi:hypothetical protein
MMSQVPSQPQHPDDQKHEMDMASKATDQKSSTSSTPAPKQKTKEQPKREDWPK